MTDFAVSTNRIPVRLTAERWNHIVENHNDMAGHYHEVLEAISSPSWIVEGDDGEQWAVKLMDKRKAFLVIYRESEKTGDGFVITAFITTKIGKLLRRRILWQPRQQ